MPYDASSRRVGTRTRFGRGNCGPMPSFTCGRGVPLPARLKTGAAAAAPAPNAALFTPAASGATAATDSTGGMDAVVGIDGVDGLTRSGS